MIELNIIEREEVPAIWLQQFKAYASIADDAQDALLAVMLTKAVLSVQQKADKSLIACTIELREDEIEDHSIRLYQTVAQVLSVKGKAAELYWEPRGHCIRVYGDSATVLYRTEPHAPDVDELLPVVFQYATALYDGEDKQTLANILAQC